MQLQEQFRGELVVVTLNVDFDGQEELPVTVVEQITALLESLDAKEGSYISESSMEVILDEYELFGLPAAIMFDAKGQIAHKYDGEVNVNLVLEDAQRLIRARPSVRN